MRTGHVNFVYGGAGVALRAGGWATLITTQWGVLPLSLLSSGPQPEAHSRAPWLSDHKSFLRHSREALEKQWYLSEMYFINDFRNSAECGGRAACSVLCPPQPQGIHLLDWEGPEKGEDTASTFIR